MSVLEEVLDPQSRGAPHWQLVEFRGRDEAHVTGLLVGNRKLAADDVRLEADRELLPDLAVGVGDDVARV